MDIGHVLPQPWLGMGLALSRHVHASDCFSWIVQACPVFGLFGLVMRAIQGIHSYLYLVHVHTCARFGFKLGQGHVRHVACVLHVCCMLFGRHCEWRLLYGLSSQHSPGTIETLEVVCDVQDMELVCDVKVRCIARFDIHVGHMSRGG